MRSARTEFFDSFRVCCAVFLHVGLNLCFFRSEANHDQRVRDRRWSVEQFADALTSTPEFLRVLRRAQPRADGRPVISSVSLPKLQPNTRVNAI